MTGKAHPLQRLCVLILAMKLQLQGFEVELSSRHAVVVSVTAFVTWKLFSMMVNKRSLAHVPGPKRSSWWKGQLLVSPHIIGDSDWLVLAQAISTSFSIVMAGHGMLTCIGSTAGPFVLRCHLE